MTANETTDHAWVRENVPTFLAGGLPDEERARFEAHVGACGSCLEDLQDAQVTEKSLAAAFAGDRPAPWLEDRLIQSLRSAPPRKLRVPSSFVRIGSAVAAVLLVGVAGYYFEASTKSSPQVAYTAPIIEGHEGPGAAFVAVAGTRGPAPEKPAQIDPDYLYGATKEGFAIRRSSSEELAKAKADELLEGWTETARADVEKAQDGARYRNYKRPSFAQANPPPAPAADPGMAEERRAQSNAYSDEAKSGPDQALKGDWFKPGAEAERKVLGYKDLDKEATNKGVQEQDATKNPAPAQDAQASQRKIIRQGEIEFEVDSFDSSVDKVVRIAQEEKGYIATINSDRLPNGKVKGTIVLRVPPDSLDRLVLKLRALGDLKSQRITSEDITKKYTDLESHLRAARTMEARLIEIIKSGKGEIKDILAAEKELGTWREKIELFEGEIRFYSNLVSLSTLTLTMIEKDFRAPSLVSVTETVDTGIESEDVLKADKDLRVLISEAKGRITASDLKKLAADQFNLLIVCEVPPDNAGPLRDRLGQLGRIARLDVQTHTTDDGKGRPVDGKVKRADTVFRISVYNTTNVQPRETSYLNLACHDVEAAFKAILARVGQASGRVVQSNLSRVKADQVGGVVHFDVPAKEAEAVLIDLRRLGEAMSFKVVENPDSANVTKSKKGFNVILLAMAHVTARETSAIRFAAKDVADAYRKIQSLVQEKKGRILDARLNEESRDNVTATLDVEIPRPDRPAVDDLLKAQGEVLAQNIQRAPDDGQVVDSKIRLTISLQTVASVGPRRIVKLGVEVSDVDAASERITKILTEGGAQLLDSQNSRTSNGRAVSYLVYEAPMEKLAAFVDQIRKAGTVRVEETRRNPNAPESGLAIGRIELTLSNPDPLVGSDAGFGAQMKDAMRSVIAAAGFSLKFIIIGALIVLPWVLIVWFAWRIVRRLRAKPAV